MKLKSLVLTGVAGAMLAAGSASAAFTGLVAELYVGAGWEATGYDAAALDTYRVYATFDNDFASVLAIGDNGGDGLAFRMLSSDGAFHNDPFGSDFAPSGIAVGLSPSVLWDTYLTIGEELGSGPGGIPMTLGAPGFAEQAAGLVGDMTLDDTGILPLDMALGDAVGGRVLLAQITVNEGVVVTGENWVVSGLADFFPFEELAGFTTMIPAPGALALLGLAGLTRRRRRHA